MDLRKLLLVTGSVVESFLKFPAMLRSLWCVVNVSCVLAAFIQLMFIIDGFINPDQLNTIISEIALKDMDFPLC